ncbi:MAG: Mur ligase domain-containing protein, partial [Candidatus Nanopelagicales bacterium]
MIKIKIKAIAEVIAAEVINLDSEIEFSGQVVIDSRNVKPGDLFVAIKGDRQDGHDFAQAAIQAGAVAVVVAKRLSEVPQLLVKETSNAPENFSQPGIWAMAKLAKYLHRELTNLKTIAITGSSGKTTTKDLIAQMSELIGESVFTYKSSNNEIGLPLTVFRCNEKT